MSSQLRPLFFLKDISRSVSKDYSCAIMIRRELESTTAIWVENTIRDFLQSTANNMGQDSEEPAWGEPLVGFSSGADPLYAQFKADIGPFYLTPEEIFNSSFSKRKVAPGHLTVISWVLPQTEATKSDAWKEFWYPPERWVRSRKYGEDCNVQLHDHLVMELLRAGFPAVAPSRSPLWEMKISERFGMTSTWSERHAAHASGLGTFGLCDGLITRVGKAMRCGSVVARIAIPPTKRSYNGPRDYCLFYAKGICGVCINRCPAGAVSAKGHDKEKCKSYILNATLPCASSRYGIRAYACGLCQTKVPCESGIP
jgi:epoxyqueuosine reductase